jgi:type VI secretion system protein ImpK
MPDIDDPFKPADATVLRPRPGGGRRAVEPAAPPAQPRRFSQPHAGPESPSLGAVDVAGTGLNPLVQAATPLLLLAGHIRGTLTAPDLSALRRHVIDEIRRFEERAQAAGVANQVVLAARYALCASLDEAVLSTPWGAHSEWSQQTLLVVMHREAWGGEKFFEMLDRVSRDPARHIDVMELLYLCLALGFAGKYQVLERGHVRLAEVQRDLYRRIREHRGVAPAELSPQWEGLKDTRSRLIRYVPGWVIGAGALAVLMVTFALYYTWLSNASAPVHAALANVGREDFTGPTPPPVQTGGPTLKELLSTEERSGALMVEEDGGRTRITLRASDLFRSGSATPNAAHVGMLERVARALNQVPGRVMVVGHTDDQPLRSLRYANNFELSQERAASVVSLLQRGANPARFESTGVGSSEPRYRPEGDPENRARNRRVEIIHVAGS